MLHTPFQSAAHSDPAREPFPGEPPFAVYQAEAREKIARSDNPGTHAPAHVMDRLVQIIATEQRRSDRLDYAHAVYEAAKAVRS